ncbi:MAG: SoxR reducing system RseC family protein [Cellulosilyticaceae bacterium]
MLIGRVENIEAEVATVTIKRQDMCGECHACEVVGEVKECKIQCHNECSSQKGDWVEIELENKLFMKATLIMYGVPLIGLLVGLGGGSVVTNFIEVQAKEIIIAVLGIIGTAIGLGIIKIKERKQKYKKLLPRLVKILEK